VNLTETDAATPRKPLIAGAVDAVVAERPSEIVLRKNAVSAVTGLPSSPLYRKVSLGEFPAPIKLGESASGWLLSEVEAWIASRREARDAVQRKKLLRTASAAKAEVQP
jgi:prophage regulatory protein